VEFHQLNEIDVEDESGKAIHHALTDSVFMYAHSYQKKRS